MSAIHPQRSFQPRHLPQRGNPRPGGNRTGTTPPRTSRDDGGRPVKMTGSMNLATTSPGRPVDSGRRARVGSRKKADQGPRERSPGPLAFRPSRPQNFRITDIDGSNFRDTVISWTSASTPPSVPIPFPTGVWTSPMRERCSPAARSPSRTYAAITERTASLPPAILPGAAWCWSGRLASGRAASFP